VCGWKSDFDLLRHKVKCKRTIVQKGRKVPLRSFRLGRQQLNVFFWQAQDNNPQSKSSYYTSTNIIIHRTYHIIIHCCTFLQARTILGSIVHYASCVTPTRPQKISLRNKKKPCKPKSFLVHHRKRPIGFCSHTILVLLSQY
jgi:hypothetical protein